MCCTRRRRGNRSGQSSSSSRQRRTTTFGLPASAAGAWCDDGRQAAGHGDQAPARQPPHRAPLVAAPAGGPPRHGGGRPPRPRLAVRSRRPVPRTRPRPLELGPLSCNRGQRRRLDRRQLLLDEGLLLRRPARHIRGWRHVARAPCAPCLSASPYLHLACGCVYRHHVGGLGGASPQIPILAYPLLRAGRERSSNQLLILARQALADLTPTKRLGAIQGVHRLACSGLGRLIAFFCCSAAAGAKHYRQEDGDDGFPVHQITPMVTVTG